MRVMIVVTHLLGAGHLTRALTIARAFEDAGHDVCLVSGGVWPAHLNAHAIPVVQLPAVRADGTDFTTLLEESGLPAGERHFAARAELLVQTLQEVQPDALITELFPFGRRALKSEFLALLNAAKTADHVPTTVASIRDILAPPSKPAKVTFANDILAQFYDSVLVHSAPDIMPLEQSWPVDGPLQAKLHYTGFVAPAPPRPHPQGVGAGEILVSAGGGAVGLGLFKCAKQAAAFDPSHRWRCLVGGAQAVAQSSALMQDAPPNFCAEPARPDFRQMLHHAAASVSLCGYNTALDILRTSCPAVFVPFDDGAEVEQSIRANALAAQPGIAVLASADLTATTLNTALARATGQTRQPLTSDHFGGAARTVEMIAAQHEARRDR